MFQGKHRMPSQPGKKCSGGFIAKKQPVEHKGWHQRLGAETATLSGHDPTEELLAYARLRNITKIIAGLP